MSWIRSYNPIWSVPDLDGAAMDDTYYFFTLENTLPYLPSPIYQDSSQTVIWSDPIEVLANGTLPDNMYFNEDLVYRLEWRKGPTQADALIYAVNNYVPGASFQPGPGDNSGDSDNQITNPQFKDLYFTGTFTSSSAGIYDIGPGWQIITEGSGILTVVQNTYIGTDSKPSDATNAPYGLSITNNGFSKITLKQRFNHNGSLWTGAQTIDSQGPGVALNVTASANDPATLIASIVYSSGETVSGILNESLNTNNTDYYKSSIIPQSLSTDPPATAYTELQFSFTANTTVNLTSVQLIGQEVVNEVTYIQTTLERQEDHEFHVYNAPLQFKPIPSLLTAWDFPLNPAQLLGDSVSVTTTPAYVWDQTIMATSSSTVAVTRNAATGGLKATTAAINQSFYMLQYLTGAQALETTLADLSVNINAYNSVHIGTNVRVYLYYCPAGAGSIPALPLSIGTIAADGTFSLTGAAIISGWVLIAPLNDVTALNSLALDGNGDIALNQFDAQANFNVSATGNNFAIVATFVSPTSGTAVQVNSISCVPGKIATRPAPQTPDEVLRECQYYYEKSFESQTVASATTTNQRSMVQQAASGGGACTVSPTAFTLIFNTQKISDAADIYFYSPTSGTVGNVSAAVRTSSGGGTVASADVTIISKGQATGNWTPTGQGTKQVSYMPSSDIDLATTGAGTSLPRGWINFQYIADARLGVV